jgi:4-alpha-glucanotransferase
MINFGFGVHIHQPIGNFDSVIEDIYKKAYKPFLELIKEFPGLKVNYHISGCLLEWTIKNHPEFIELLKELVKKEQVEILTSGFYEPILTLLPENDRIDQIKWYSDFLEKKFGIRPNGLWLTERVWEQNLTKSLVEVGIKYTVVDDTHFKYSGLTDEELHGYYMTEEAGKTLAIFPVSKKLRYFVPFQPVTKSIEFLKEDMTKGDNRFKLLFDDGEKFGSWPGTHKLCYDEGWLKDFLTSLIQSDFIQTTLLNQYLASSPPLGRIYLDNASYEEMGEWVLPPKVYEQYESVKPNLPPNFSLLRGGYFRNFLVKYPEVNRLHKRMFFVSRKINKSTSKNKKGARIELFKSQCNDVYWHGIFGGLYLPHLRNGVYQHLVKADKMIGADSKTEPLLYDFDACGKNEIIFDNQEIFLVASPRQGGAIQCLDIKKYGINLFDIISRHQENYHQKIKSVLKSRTPDSEPAKTIHSELKLKDTDVEHNLIYDNYERLALLDHFLNPEVKVEDFYYNQFQDAYNIINQNRTYTLKHNEVSLKAKGFCPNSSGILNKTIRLNSNQIKFACELKEISASPENPIRFGVEFGFRPLKHLTIGDRLIDNTAIGQRENTEEFSMLILDPEIEINLKSADNPFDLWYLPIYSVSSSESGLEHIYQGTVLLLSWLLKSPETKPAFQLAW